MLIDDPEKIISGMDLLSVKLLMQFVYNRFNLDKTRYS